MRGWEFFCVVRSRGIRRYDARPLSDSILILNMRLASMCSANLIIVDFRNPIFWQTQPCWCIPSAATWFDSGVGLNEETHQSQRKG